MLHACAVGGQGLDLEASPGFTPIITLLQQHRPSCLKHHPQRQLCSLHLLLRVLMIDLQTSWGR